MNFQLLRVQSDNALHVDVNTYRAWIYSQPGYLRKGGAANFSVTCNLHIPDIDEWNDTAYLWSRAITR